MLNELLEALCTQLAPLDMPVFLADCIPNGVGMPYLAMEIALPMRPADPGKVTLTLWCSGGSAHAERVRLGDELLGLLPAHGICLRLAEHSVTLRPTGSISTLRSGAAIGLRLTLALGCVPLKATAACTLDGTSLTDAADGLLLLDVREDAPRLRTETFPRPDGGTTTILCQRESLSVRVELGLHAPDPAKWQAAVSALSARTEGGGMLSLSTRPGQRLRVDRAALSVPSAEDWTDKLTLTLTALEVPWWEAEQPVSAVITETGMLTVPGSTSRAPADVTVTNCGDGVLTQVQLVCGDTQMAFDSLALSPGDALTLSAARGMLSARVGQESVLTRRTALSDDLLLAECGKVSALSVRADQPVSAAFSVRGRYL